MDKNTWLEALNKETRENAEFAYLWAMIRIRVEYGVNTYSVCKVEDAMAITACKAGRKTRNASANRRMRDDAMKSCGLTKVYGSVSGKVYWE